MSTEKRLSGRAIAKKMKINRPTVAKILAKYQNTGGVQDRRGRGRKRKMPKEDEGKFLRKAKKKNPQRL